MNELEFQWVTPNANEELKESVEQYSREINKEVGYDQNPYSRNNNIQEYSINAIIVMFDNERIGLCVVEKRLRYEYITWEYLSTTNDFREKESPIWTISFIWVQEHFRRRGIGTSIINEVERFLDIKADKLGYFIPLSDKMVGLLQRKYKTGIYLVCN